MAKLLSLRRIGVVATFVAVGMMMMAGSAFAAGNGGGGSGGGGHMYPFTPTTNTTLLTSYLIEGGSINGVSGRIIVTSPPADSGELPSAHVIGLSGLKSATYYVWFYQANLSPAWTIAPNPINYVAGTENEYSAAIPYGYTKFQVYIGIANENPNPATNMLLSTKDITVSGAGAGQGGSSSTMYPWVVKTDALNCYLPADTENSNGVQSRVVVSVSRTEGAVAHVIGFGAVVTTGTYIPVAGNTAVPACSWPEASVAAHYYVWFVDKTTGAFTAAINSSTGTNELVYVGTESEFGATAPTDTTYKVVITGDTAHAVSLLETDWITAGSTSGSGHRGGGGGGGGGGGRGH